MNRSERRAKGHRGPSRPRRRLNPDAWYCTVAGWAADEGSVEAAKRETHDAVISLAGAKRRGGVMWTIDSGEDAERQLSTMWDGAEPDVAASYRQIRGLLRERGGFLVVAMAEAER